MTPQEQIAKVRGNVGGNGADDRAILAVCDLAERALLDDDKREAVAALIEAARSQAGLHKSNRAAAGSCPCELCKALGRLDA